MIKVLAYSIWITTYILIMRKGDMILRLKNKEIFYAGEKDKICI